MPSRVIGMVPFVGAYPECASGRIYPDLMVSCLAGLDLDVGIRIGTE